MATLPACVGAAPQPPFAEFRQTLIQELQPQHEDTHKRTKKAHEIEQYNLCACQARAFHNNHLLSVSTAPICSFNLHPLARP
jgi:hypothetical protein